MLFSLRQIIHIPSVRVVHLLCCGGHFITTVFIDAKTKYRSPYILDVSCPYLYNYISTSLGHPWDVSEGRPQDVGRTRHLALHTGQYGDVLRTF